jgi:hypothetical protein
MVKVGTIYYFRKFEEKLGGEVFELGGEISKRTSSLFGNSNSAIYLPQKIYLQLLCYEYIDFMCRGRNLIINLYKAIINKNSIVFLLVIYLFVGASIFLVSGSKKK